MKQENYLMQLNMGDYKIMKTKSRLTYKIKTLPAYQIAASSLLAYKNLYQINFQIRYGVTRLEVANFHPHACMREFYVFQKAVIFGLKKAINSLFL